jgi:transcriptional regulator of acetoin/glycerol metabolism
LVDHDPERLVAKARQRFLESGDISQPEVRHAVVESWQRSRSFGVDVDRLDPPLHPDIDLDSKLMRAARPILTRLERVLTGTRVSVLLTDAQGRVLARLAGENALNKHLDAIKLAPGFSYAEEHVGTNGIGTALQTRQPYHVFGSEHFAERLQTMSCAGAPIRNPLSRRLVGLLDLTCWSADATPLMAALVQEAASHIEQRLLDDGSERERAMLTEFLAACRHSGKAILTVSDAVTISNPRAQGLLDANDHGIVREVSERLLARGREQTGQVLLSQGELAIVRCRPVECASGTAGAVVEITLAPVAGRRRSPPATTGPVLRLAGSNVGFQNACRELDACCRGGTSALVEGEPGVGKLAVVEALHRRCRPTGHLSVIDARTWSDESAKRLALAVDLAGSTVLLRHLDRLPPETAEWVARVLDGFAGQWVAATTVEHAAVPEVLLRRFAVTVTIRPLRYRIDDVRELVPALLRRLAPGQEISCGPAAMRILLRSQWPGNIAELVTVLRTALGRRRAGAITPKDLPEFCHVTSRRVLTPWETLERDAIVRTLLDTGGDRPKAAATLGISRATVYRKITTYGIVVDPD